MRGRRARHRPARHRRVPMRGRCWASSRNWPCSFTAAAPPRWSSAAVPTGATTSPCSSQLARPLTSVAASIALEHSRAILAARERRTGATILLRILGLRRSHAAARRTCSRLRKAHLLPNLSPWPPGSRKAAATGSSKRRTAARRALRLITSSWRKQPRRRRLVCLRSPPRSPRVSSELGFHNAPPESRTLAISSRSKEIQKEP